MVVESCRSHQACQYLLLLCKNITMVFQYFVWHFQGFCYDVLLVMSAYAIMSKTKFRRRPEYEVSEVSV